MAFDFFVNHALKNVWCTPQQDLQARVKPKRITGVYGVRNRVVVLQRSHLLPLANTRFHVYQIGQLNPQLMGLLDPADTNWVVFSDVCMAKKLIVDFYSNKGVQLPRFECWYKVTEEKALIIAIKEQPTINFNLRTEDLFVRVYTNAYFQSVRSDSLTDFIYVESKRVTNQNDILTIQQSYIDYSALSGGTYAFVNGYKVSAIDLFTVAPGDVVEFIHDSSIYKIVDFTVGDLLYFNSTLDVKHKYLLHYLSDDNGTIDYQDDIDIFIVKPYLSGRHYGVYYHRNQQDSVRMVTHRDYAIPVAYVLGYASYQEGWTDPDELIVRLHIRKSGYFRPLIKENNRIHELYKLPGDGVLRAMLGLDSTISNWRAEALEESGYTRIMRSSSNDVNINLVRSAYGYNFMSKLISDTPTFTRSFSGQTVADVPYGLQNNSSVFEYDAEGLLIDSHHHNQGSIYAAINSGAALVEILAGGAGTALDEVYGAPTTTIDPIVNYRFYRCPIVSGNPTNVWEDVTGSGNYAIINNVVTWLMDLAAFYPLIRSDRKILSYSFTQEASEGILEFSLKHQATRNNVTSDFVMQIPMGELDVFLNKHSLIEGLDYFVHFPKIVIINKKYLVDPLNQDQVIDIRFSGFCKNDLTREPYTEYGFIQWGLLSNNNRFDLRDDKIVRIITDGKLRDRSELIFSESDSGVTVPDATNGTPYLIRDVVAPMRDVTINNTYEFRALSQIIDQRVSDYLSLKIPEPTFETPNVVEDLYPIFSPFCCKILYDLKREILVDNRIKHHYNDTIVREICAPYEYLLAFDPTQEDQSQDPRYVAIHPHNLLEVIDLDIYFYKFLNRVISLYLHNKVTLSHFVTIAAS